MRAALLLVAVAVTPVVARDFSRPGPHPVGTTTLTFTKASETTGTPRVLATRIWYPAKPGTGGAGDVHTDAEVARGRWPLVVFSHGSCGFPDQSPFFTAGLAAWGFVVAAPPHPGNTTHELATCNTPEEFADSFANRVADVRFVIDQMLAAARDRTSRFAGRLNPRRIGMSGHSFGAQTTLRVLAADSRVRAGVALAPTTLGITDLSITRPTLVATGAIDSVTPFATEARGAFAFLHGPRYLVELDASGHCAFTIACVPELCGVGCTPDALPLAEAHTLTMRWAVPFFVRYVAGRSVGRALREGKTPSAAHLVESHGR